MGALVRFPASSSTPGGTGPAGPTDAPQPPGGPARIAQIVVIPLRPPTEGDPDFDLIDAVNESFVAEVRAAFAVPPRPERD